MTHRAFRFTALLIAVAAAGCDVSGPMEFRVPGRIFDEPPDEPAISAPDTVAPGEAFEVTVRTAGGGCTRKGDTEALLLGDSAVVVPYDIRIRNLFRETLCPGYLAVYQHVATISFPGPGEGLLIVRGADWAGKSVELRRSIVVE